MPRYQIGAWSLNSDARDSVTYEYDPVPSAVLTAWVDGNGWVVDLSEPMIDSQYKDVTNVSRGLDDKEEALWVMENFMQNHQNMYSEAEMQRLRGSDTPHPRDRRGHFGF